MSRLCLLTVPGLNVATDWAAVHDRLLDDSPEVTDVLATTITATLLIVYEGDAKLGDWLEGITTGIRSRRLSARARTSQGRSEGAVQPSTPKK